MTVSIEVKDLHVAVKNKVSETAWGSESLTALLCVHLVLVDAKYRLGN